MRELAITKSRDAVSHTHAHTRIDDERESLRRRRRRRSRWISNAYDRPTPTPLIPLICQLTSKANRRGNNILNPFCRRCQFAGGRCGEWGNPQLGVVGSWMGGGVVLSGGEDELNDPCAPGLTERPEFKFDPYATARDCACV